MADEAADAIDALYELDPSEFTAARNALVKRLKAEKRKDEAAAVALLRRPSTAAWALNQVAREEPDLVEAALEAGAKLRDATGDAFRAATADERVAVAAVVKAAVRRLGVSETPAALTATVHAAEVDDDVADQLRRGVLTADHQRTGLGFGFGLDDDDGGGDAGTVVPRATKPAPAKKARALRSVPAVQKADPAPEVDEAAALEAEAERKAQEAASAARREAEAERRRQIVQLTDRVTRAKKKAARLGQEAGRAEAAAAELRAQAVEAADAVTELAEALAALDPPD